MIFAKMILQLDRPSPTEKNKNLVGLMKHELGGKIMKRFVELRAKSYSYLKDDGNEDEKARHKKVCHKKKTYV